MSMFCKECVPTAAAAAAGSVVVAAAAGTTTAAVTTAATAAATCITTNTGPLSRVFLRGFWRTQSAVIPGLKKIVALKVHIQFDFFASLISN